MTRGEGMGIGIPPPVGLVELEQGPAMLDLGMAWVGAETWSICDSSGGVLSKLAGQL